MKAEDLSAFEGVWRFEGAFREGVMRGTEGAGGGSVVC